MVSFNHENFQNYVTLHACTGGAVHGHGSSLSGEEVHLRIVTCSQALSDACTKMSVLFSSPPCPSAQDCGVICTKIEHSTLFLASACSQLEPSQGKKKTAPCAIVLQVNIALLHYRGCSSTRDEEGSVWNDPGG